MKKKFVVAADYGIGEMAMLTDTPELSKALVEFYELRKSLIPDTKDYGVPPVVSAKIIPCLYESIYEHKEEDEQYV